MEKRILVYISVIILLAAASCGHRRTEYVGKWVEKKAVDGKEQYCGFYVLLFDNNYAITGKHYDLKNNIPYFYQAWNNWIITGDDIHFLDSFPKMNRIYYDIFEFEGDYMQVRIDSGRVYDLVRQPFSHGDSAELQMLQKNDNRLRQIKKYLPR